MWWLTLAQMHRSAGRLTAAAVAIAIGTAFVAATLLAGDVMRRISSDSITASYGSSLRARPKSSYGVWFALGKEEGRKTGSAASS